MITKCPACQNLISVDKTGENLCKKCGSLIFVGDPLRDEENKIILQNAFNPDSIKEKDDEDVDLFDESDDIFDDDLKENKKNTSSFSYRDRVKDSLDEKSSQKEPAVGVPWDRISELGFVEAIYQTSAQIIFNPTHFFIDMKYAKPNSFVPLYGIIFAIIGQFFTVFWTLFFFTKIFPVYKDFFPQETAELLSQIKIPAQGELFFQTIISPVVSIIINSMLIFGVSYILGARPRLSNYYRLMGFLSFFDILYIIPVIGNIIVFFWKFVLIVKGVKIINIFPTWKALLVCFLFFIVSLIFTLPLFFSGS